jgi:excisionase family DNA binding protein
MESRLLYDRKEAARQLSISVRSLDYLIAAKQLDTRRIGRKVLVTRASLVRYASANHFDAVKDTISESTATLRDASSKCA